MLRGIAWKSQFFFLIVFHFWKKSENLFYNKLDLTISYANKSLIR
jgi:hypothetical protein